MTFTTTPSTEIENPDGTPMDFINLITVAYDAQSKPMSRQGRGKRTKKVYSFDDNLDSTSTQPTSQVGFKLVWQYYVTSASGLIKNLGINGKRQIVGLKSNNIVPDITLEDNDTITWRLVAIFGLSETAQEAVDAGLLANVPSASGRDLGALLGTLK